MYVGRRLQPSKAKDGPQAQLVGVVMTIAFPCLHNLYPLHVLIFVKTLIPLLSAQVALKFEHRTSKGCNYGPPYEWSVYG